MQHIETMASALADQGNQILEQAIKKLMEVAGFPADESNAREQLLALKENGYNIEQIMPQGQFLTRYLELTLNGKSIAVAKLHTEMPIIDSKDGQITAKTKLSYGKFINGQFVKRGINKS